MSTKPNSSKCPVTLLFLSSAVKNCPSVFFLLLSCASANLPSPQNLKSLLQGNGNGTSDSGDGNGGNNGENGGSSLKVTEQQVARLMEEDMGTAMQYLQGKGLCLMPISLASAISSATSPSLLSRPSIGSMGGNAGSPPSMMNGAGGDDSRTGKDAGAGCKQ
jgi:hypothetical protein